jgi:hypothetical protein
VRRLPNALRVDGVQVPGVRNAFQLVCTLVLKAQAGSRHQVLPFATDCRSPQQRPHS